VVLASRKPVSVQQSPSDPAAGSGAGAGIVGAAVIASFMLARKMRARPNRS